MKNDPNINVFGSLSEEKVSANHRDLANEG